MFLEATGQVFRGDSDDVFTRDARGDLSYVGHLRGYQDITESTNIDLGVSVRARPQRLRASSTARLRPVHDRPLRRRRDVPLEAAAAVDLPLVPRPRRAGLEPARSAGWPQDGSGFYVSGDYQFARRWFAGAALDRSDRADDASLSDTGQSLLLTFKPSEFSQIRGQYRRTNYADGATANEFLFQFQFAIGAHGAHPF